MRAFPQEAEQKGALYKHFREWLSATYEVCFSQHDWKGVLDEDARAMESHDTSPSPSPSARSALSSQLSYCPINSQEVGSGPEQ